MPDMIPDKGQHANEEADDAFDELEASARIGEGFILCMRIVINPYRRLWLTEGELSQRFEPNGFLTSLLCKSLIRQ